MFKNMKLKKKLVIYFLLVGIVPFLTIALISTFQAMNALEANAFNQLKAVQIIKKTQVKNYLDDTFIQMQIFARSKDVKELYSQLVKYHNDMNTGATENYDVSTNTYNEIWKKYGNNILQFQKDSGFYDVFLMCSKHGHVMYTAAKEGDIGENLAVGQYRESGLAKLWDEVVTTRGLSLIDFSPYAPSNNEPASFAGLPIMDDNGNIIGVIAFQLSIDKLNKIMQERAGMGETGETYLVGSDYRMRSDSFLDPSGHSVKASFAGTIEKNGVKTKAAKEAINGNSGSEIITDYYGNQVLSVYSPIDLQDGVRWAVIAEIDKAEAFAASNSMIKWAVILSIIIGLIIGFFGLTIAKSIAKPIIQIAEAADEVQKGNTDIQVNVDTNDEIGSLAVSFNGMVEKIDMQIGYLDKLPTPIHIRDKDHKIIYINEFGASLAGLTQKEAIGKNCYDLFKTEHCQNEGCVVDCAMRDGKLVSDETVSRATGERKYISHTGSPVVNKAGELVGGLEYISDIDELKNNEIYLERNTAMLLEAMDKFSKGDLTVNVNAEKTDDDIGKLIAGFNIAITKIRNMITQVNEAVQATSSASTQISSSAEEMAAGAQEQSSQTAEVSAAMEEMSRTIVETANNATNSAEVSQTATKKANEGNEKLEASKKGMEEIVSATGTVGNSISSLANKTDQIGEIAQVIDDIADQTNLLALNAAIEAARAGEQGRGFAVVADEVRKLAERTTKATKEIAETIKEIQTEAKEANSSMEAAGVAVNKGLDLNDDVGDVLNEIIESVEDVAQQITQVAAASEEQSATAEQVSTNIEAINNVANESAQGVQQIAQASEDLNRLTENLSELVMQFRLDNGNGRNLSSYSVNQNAGFIEG